MPEALTLAALERVMALTARGPAIQAWRAVEQLAHQAFGPALFTVNRVLHGTQEVERLYSGAPDHYPVGGRKQKRGTVWAGHVLERGEVFVAQGPPAIRAHFDDHARILGLGIQEIVNVPVPLAGRVVAVMNLSRPEIGFDEADRPRLALVAALLLPLILDDKD